MAGDYTQTCPSIIRKVQLFTGAENVKRNSVIFFLDLHKHSERFQVEQN